MFRPARVLQTAIIAAMLAGCAARPAQPPGGGTAVSAMEPEPGAAPSPRAAAPRDASSTGATEGARPGHASSPLAMPGPGAGGASSAPAPARMRASDSDGFLSADGSLPVEIQRYAAVVAQERQLPPAHVLNLLRDARYNATVARLMAPPPSGRIRRSWVTYRKRFVDPIRIEKGLEFWRTNRAALERVARRQGVPPAIIVAIIGVETVYGRNMGGFRVLDALTTLAFRYPDPGRPERQALFKDQLADLIQLDSQGALDARSATGSYAGAMGLPQFMPGSLLNYAVDGDGDQRIDLAASPDDAIASVANFLRKHGWQPGLPVFAPVILPDKAGQWVKGGLEPTYAWDELRAAGARERSGMGPDGWKQQLLGVVDLVDEPRNTAEYRAGTPNFFALTHYNRSYFYASSVADLAAVLAARMNQPAP